MIVIIVLTCCSVGSHGWLIGYGNVGTQSWYLADKIARLQCNNVLSSPAALG
jgi:hypothetical protein